jgi:hypothetical protein
MYEKKCGERGKKFKQVNKDGMDENNKKHQGKIGVEMENIQVRNFIFGNIFMLLSARKLTPLPSAKNTQVIGK